MKIDININNYENYDIIAEDVMHVMHFANLENIIYEKIANDAFIKSNEELIFTYENSNFPLITISDYEENLEDYNISKIRDIVIKAFDKFARELTRKEEIDYKYMPTDVP
jgi:hypothetical protein